MSEPHGRSDFGDLMCAVVPTPDGPAAGRSKDGPIWYFEKELSDYDGRGERSLYMATKEYSGPFKVLEGDVIFTANPDEICKFGTKYCAVATTKWGKIPGEAYEASNVCAVGYKSDYGIWDSTITTDFQYVGLRKPHPNPVVAAAEIEVCEIA